MFGVWIAQTPIHEKVPDGAKYRIEACECYEDRTVFVGAIDAIEAECHKVEN